MRNLNQDTITQAVIARLSDTPDARLKEVLTCVVQHLHALARELRLTEAELQAGIEFLTAVGKKCSPSRQEFVLLADVLGLSTLTVAMNHDKPLTLRVPLDFLGSGTHTIRIFADKPESATTPTEITDTARPVTAKDLLEIPMVANGGFAARIRRGRHSPPAAIGGLGHHSVSRPLRGMAMKIDAKVH